MIIRPLPSRIQEVPSSAATVTLQRDTLEHCQASAGLARLVRDYVQAHVNARRTLTCNTLVAGTPV